MSYNLQEVPTFLLHDGISWCRKNGRPRVRFYQTFSGIREEIISTPGECLEEINRRKTEKGIITLCVSCGSDTDGRCFFIANEFLCEPCYWETIKIIHGGTPVSPQPLQPRQPNNIIAFKPRIFEETPRATGPQEETPEQTAARLGVSLSMLQDMGYFD
jgi:hypothetical protein